MRTPFGALAAALLLFPVARRSRQAKDRFEAGETTRVDLLRAEADGKAAEERLVSARQYLEVRATVDPYPGETFDGTVSVVVPALDLASRTFAVEALFPNRDGRLRPGLFARVELERAPARR